MQVSKIGQSHNEAPLLSYSFGEGKKILLLSGVHGDEIEGVALLQSLLASFIEQEILGLEIHCLPQFNPDGILAKTRANAKGVDLNRNLPTKDWNKEAFNPRYHPGDYANSEPENQALVELIDKNKYSFCISFHSFSKYLLNVNGECNPYAEFLSKKIAYPIEPSMGYPTPGCLGTYTGLERNIPTITYELERGKDLKDLIAIHKNAVIEMLIMMSEKL